MCLEIPSEHYILLILKLVIETVIATSNLITLNQGSVARIGAIGR